ncbi:xanthine dehydrogenase family protein molybdopterin-binding subunit [Bradyrhizobium elkanii]|uniref:xanthine dehydrogenase family protein molybdopterin-binding subunit n=1 Tax=Bradyrhizobium elkanii TaxID=29448 RepID=UPI0020A0962C|nr:molybdopterin cofactor-binding domain-containing protein [Bradyrhizobium elkanii]MCP1973835.1 CO/xanthine dehydrogenase Mo-binding subunit [Bradyrhizobium elkanii]MCS3520898.1 CO/xanthine dehydrogenase Mo-binding subunit [Bradyrhizobium elkanii]MCS4068555.1 CO/xanthine dehydrogenase Mo-binding subunit [Bradyrhizobium elkanii]MCS4084089.1 CO/xanthine dehydrogenase Mo-binding subunit [Bradyrhizobium elkanii]MCS4104660.1 CO/xanthine dehydrogenase Mo-binding subunit [Bradyrhizobium elkanii]
MTAPVVLDRRSVLAGGGALIVSFSLRHAVAQEQTATQSPELPGSLAKSPNLDSWIRIDANGQVTAFTGKAELGQGFRTAFQQIAAEQLDIPFDALKVITADTKLTANEGYTSGSHSMQDSGTAILHAAAQARALLVAEAGRRFDLPPEGLRTENAAVVAPDGRRLGYGELVAANMLHVQAQPTSSLKDPASFKVMGQPVPRVDIPAKVTGAAAYVQDMRLPGMVHARVVRPPSYGAQLVECDTAAIEKMPGVIQIVRDGNFLAVVAENEFSAVKAMHALAAAAKWRESAKLPNQHDLANVLTALPSKDFAIFQRSDPTVSGARSLQATYTRPYQSHGSIGPSCAVAQFVDGAMTVWTHTQGVYPDRQAIAEMLGMTPASVRLIHVEGSGCYGHNGADDAAADAALVARALPGRPIRVQWMREEEHGWEPYGPAMVTKLSASLTADGKVADWNFAVWSNTHSMRPGGAGALLAAQHMARSFAVPAPKPLPLPEGGGDRNAIPIYNFPNAHVMHHFIPAMPLRISAMRALGAYHNVFSTESFMDELAALAGADPVEFRLRHLDDQRGRAVVEKAAEEFGWTRGRQPPRNGGNGFAFARYKNLAAYCAIASEVEVDRETGRARLVRAVAAVDAGQVVNPDGITNQIEGAIVQSTSWTLYESVTFDDTRITSIDWQTYPILRFNAVPDSIAVHIINRPGQPFLGSGETGQGPAAASLANAIAHATGRRLRDLPLSRKRIKDAIDA